MPLRLLPRATPRGVPPPLRRLHSTHAPPAAPLPLPAASPYLYPLPPAPWKPSSLAGVATEWVIDNPGLFFGSLVAALIAYIVHGSVGGNQREKAVAAVERAAPLSAREVTEVGRMNAVNRAVFEAAAERVIAACPGGLATPAEVSLALRSEMAAHAGAGAGGSSGGSSLAGEHHLRRAARALAVASELAQGEGALLAGSQGEVGEGALPAGSSAARRLCGDDHDGADAEVPLLELLSLYGTTMGGRQEPRTAAAAASTEDEAYPTPSERMDIWLWLVRKAGAVGAEGGAVAAADGATGIVASGATPGDGAPSLSGASPTCPPGMIRHSELLRLVSLLSDTWQLPARARVHQVGTWPYPTHAPRTAQEHLADAMLEVKLEEEREKAAERRAAAAAAAAALAATDGAAGAREGASRASEAAAQVPLGHFVDPTTLDLHPASCALPGGGEDRLFSRSEALRLVLRSKAVCAWNECGRDSDR